MTTLSHITVLQTEAVSALSVKPDGHYFDGTFGRGGHSGKVLSQLSDKGRLFATDKDPEAQQVAQQIKNSSFVFKAGNFSQADMLFPEIEAESLDGVLLDLGVSSPQLDNAERGFSFMRDGGLDMRMNPNEGISAKAFIEQVSYSDLVSIIFKLGEERFAKQIAKNIIKQRDIQPIETTKQLAEIIERSIPVRFHTEGRHPATKTFQAIRMHLNQELDEVEKGLSVFYKLLKKGGKIVVISFHSLEDSEVKRFLKTMKFGESLPPEIPVSDARSFDKMKSVGKVIKPSEKEVLNNPRARSALMRVMEKI